MMWYRENKGKKCSVKDWGGCGKAQWDNNLNVKIYGLALGVMLRSFWTQVLWVQLGIPQRGRRLSHSFSSSNSLLSLRLTGWIMVLLIFQVCINAIDLTCLFWRAIRAPLCCIYRLYCGLSLQHGHILHSTLPPSPCCFLAVNFIVKHQQKRCAPYFCLREQTTLC